MKIEFRKAKLEDAEIYFQWTNDILVRENSYQQKKISFEEHINWFKRKLNSSDCFFYFFISGDKAVGQVRIDKSNDEIVIGISIDTDYRGKRLGISMLEMACEDYFKKFPHSTIYAYIKQGNIPSHKIFKEANFVEDQIVSVKGIDSVKLSKTKK